MPALVVALGLAACGTAGDEAGGREPASGGFPTAGTVTPEPVAPRAATEPRREPAPAPRLPAVAAWEPGPGESLPRLKVTATRALEAAGTWSDADGDRAAVAARLGAAGAGPVPAARLSDLSDEDADAATVEVVYPQHGGLTATAASVIVLLEQRLLARTGQVRSRELVVDVRLGRSREPASPWRVTGIASDPPAPARQETGAAADAVLANPGVALPAPARRDVRQGRIGPQVLALLDDLGSRYDVDVLVLTSGHPADVFGTDRRSNHTLGRAVDIWRVDGQRVADPDTSRALLEAVMRRAARLGATQVGGPFDLNGDRPGFFTDRAHTDHLHIGFAPDRPPARP